MIFANDMPQNLGLLQCGLEVHSPEECREMPGRYPVNRKERIHLGNLQAIRFEDSDLVIFE